MEGNGKNSVFPLVIISLVILLLVVGAYWFGKNSIVKNNLDRASEIAEEDKAKESTPDEEIVEEIKESGTSPEENLTEEDKVAEEKADEEESDEDIIETLKLLFAQKYEKNVEDANVTINKREGDFLTGGIIFDGEISGGYVLAAKVKGVWKIISDGNGIYTCSAVDAVDFPPTLAPECWDENTMSVVDRTTR